MGKQSQHRALHFPSQSPFRLSTKKKEPIQVQQISTFQFPIQNSPITNEIQQPVLAIPQPCSISKSFTPQLNTLFSPTQVISNSPKIQHSETVPSIAFRQNDIDVDSQENSFPCLSENGNSPQPSIASSSKSAASSVASSVLNALSTIGGRILPSSGSVMGFASTIWTGFKTEIDKRKNAYLLAKRKERTLSTIKKRNAQLKAVQNHIASKRSKGNLIVVSNSTQVAEDSDDGASISSNSMNSKIQAVMNKFSRPRVEKVYRKEGVLVSNASTQLFDILGRNKKNVEQSKIIKQNDEEKIKELELQISELKKRTEFLEKQSLENQKRLLTEQSMEFDESSLKEENAVKRKFVSDSETIDEMEQSRVKRAQRSYDFGFEVDTSSESEENKPVEQESLKTSLNSEPEENLETLMNEQDKADLYELSKDQFSQEQESSKLDSNQDQLQCFQDTDNDQLFQSQNNSKVSEVEKELNDYLDSESTPIRAFKNISEQCASVDEDVENSKQLDFQIVMKENIDTPNEKEESNIDMKNNEQTDVIDMEHLENSVPLVGHEIFLNENVEKCDAHQSHKIELISKVIDIEDNNAVMISSENSCDELNLNEYSKTSLHEDVNNDCSDSEEEKADESDEFESCMENDEFVAGYQEIDKTTNLHIEPVDIIVPNEED